MTLANNEMAIIASNALTTMAVVVGKGRDGVKMKSANGAFCASHTHHCNYHCGQNGKHGTCHLSVLMLTLRMVLAMAALLTVTYYYLKVLEPEKISL